MNNTIFRIHTTIERHKISIGYTAAILLLNVSNFCVDQAEKIGNKLEENEKDLYRRVCERSDFLKD